MKYLKPSRKVTLEFTGRKLGVYGLWMSTPKKAKNLSFHFEMTNEKHIVVNTTRSRIITKQFRIQIIKFQSLRPKLTAVNSSTWVYLILSTMRWDSVKQNIYSWSTRCYLHDDILVFLKIEENFFDTLRAFGGGLRPETVEWGDSGRELPLFTFLPFHLSYPPAW